MMNRLKSTRMLSYRNMKSFRKSFLFTTDINAFGLIIILSWRVTFLLNIGILE